MENKKGKLKVFIILAIVFVVIAIGILGTIFVLSKAKSKDLEKKLSKIEANNIEQELIDELEDTSINVDINTKNYSNDSISIETMIISTRDFEGESSNELLKEIRDYVVAWGWGEKNGKPSPLYIIPCFKVESDSDGNLKSITYVYSEDKNTIEYIIAKTVEKHLSEKYDIDVAKLDKSCIKDSANTGLRLIKSDEYITEYLVPYITGSSNKKEPKMNTRTIGIDVNK